MDPVRQAPPERTGGAVPEVLRAPTAVLVVHLEPTAVPVAQAAIPPRNTDRRDNTDLKHNMAAASMPAAAPVARLILSALRRGAAPI